MHYSRATTFVLMIAKPTTINNRKEEGEGNFGYLELVELDPHLGVSVWNITRLEWKAARDDVNTLTDFLAVALCISLGGINKQTSAGHVKKDDTT